MFGRRSFTQRALGVAAAALLPRPARAAEDFDPLRDIVGVLLPGLARPLIDLSELGNQASMALRFHRWVAEQGIARDREVRNLVFNFYDTSKRSGSWLHPMSCGKAIVWLLGRRRTADAVVIGEALLRWQQTIPYGAWERSYGAFPSAIDRDPESGGWKAAERYYSGDNLVIMEALLSLWRATRGRQWLNAAVGIGTWLCTVMCQGMKYNIWAEDHGAPTWFVTAAGDFSNYIYNNVEMLWISALHRLGRITREHAYCRQAEKAYRFYKLSQTTGGAFHDHYDPGYPPQKYTPERWVTYQGSQVICDSVLRAALACCRWADIDMARKTMDWIQVQGGAVPAYLDIETGGPAFEPNAEVYFDITSTGMYRSLCQWLGNRGGAEEAVAFLQQTQDPHGGWCRGVYGDLKPIRTEMCPLPGFWATADLSAVER
jgi:hypothetical protein